jgi:hypothetical protein
MSFRACDGCWDVPCTCKYIVSTDVDSEYLKEHVDEFLRLTAGGKPLTTIEIDEETYDYITLLSDHWKMTRRQAFTKIMKTATDKVFKEHGIDIPID